jgi:hypothetical protein
MLTRPEVEALRTLLAGAPAPGSMRRPNAVGALVHRLYQWQAEAAPLRARLERALAEHLQQPRRAPQRAQEAT